MGLDTVELVMEIEDEFALRIPDDRAELMQTAGDVVDFIVERLEGRLPPRGLCPSAAAFYRLRRAILEQIAWSLPPNYISPRACVRDALPVDNPHIAWERVATRVGLSARPCRLLDLDTPLRRIVEQMCRRDPGEFFTNGRPDRGKIWRRVRRIVSEQFGVCEDDIRQHTHFINDLGAG
jgi:acyl carrier protein